MMCIAWWNPPSLIAFLKGSLWVQATDTFEAEGGFTEPLLKADSTTIFGGLNLAADTRIKLRSSLLPIQRI